MEKIYSKKEPQKILHIIKKKRDIIGPRQDLCEDHQFLQVALLKMESGKKIKSHKHLETYKIIERTQESLVVINGKIKAIYYDTDEKILTEKILEEGDCSITFQGGHSYEVLGDAIAYEIKTGPYQGQEKDLIYF